MRSTSERCWVTSLLPCSSESPLNARTSELCSCQLHSTQNSSPLFFGNCPTFSIPGRLFPVKPLYLEDVLHLTKFQMDPAELDRFSRMTRRTTSKRSVSGVGPNINSSLQQRFKHWLWKGQSSLSPGSKQFMEALDLLGCPPPELVATVIDHIIQTTESGAILAFVPGLGDIIETTKALRRINPHLYAETSCRVKIYPLHSRLPSARQRSVFDPPPRGQRKIVVATNIAETSITIEDVVFVVDCGHIKLTTYDPQTNTSTLAPVLVSKANAAQRRGRAGRVQPGICYHLFSSFVRDEVMLENLPPEITRIRLDDVILRIKALDLGPVTQFLQSCLEPPAPDAIDRTLKFLRDIQALEPVTRAENDDSTSSVPVLQTSKMSKKQRQRLMNNAIQNGVSSATSTPILSADNDRLTSLGYHLANLPLEPQCAKLLILGALFCCLEPILAVAACLAFKDPFEVPLDKQAIGDRKRQELAGDSLSDHWVYHVVLSEYRALRSYSEKSQYCWRNFLNQRTMEDLRHLMQDFAGLLYERRYIGSARFDDEVANRNSYNINVFRAVLAGALYPNFVMLTERPQKHAGAIPPPIIEGRPSEGAVSIHPKSVNGFMRPIGQAWLAYFTRLKLDHGAKSTIFDTTAIGSRPIVFFSGKVSNLKVGDEEVLILDDWIRFKSPHRLAQLMKSLKKCIDKLLDCKIRRPGPTDWDQQTIEGRLLQIIVDLFTSEPPVLTHIKTERLDAQKLDNKELSPYQNFNQRERFQPRGGPGRRNF
uniref:Helicase C-terminal domain-containing protein n=1 Tax=Schistocephalus solidus TaxID=70667 RepID=A0A0X3NUH3_SCHSO